MPDSRRSARHVRRQLEEQDDGAELIFGPLAGDRPGPVTEPDLMAGDPSGAMSDALSDALAGAMPGDPMPDVSMPDVPPPGDPSPAGGRGRFPTPPNRPPTGSVPIRQFNAGRPVAPLPRIPIAQSAAEAPPSPAPPEPIRATEGLPAWTSPPPLTGQRPVVAGTGEREPARPGTEAPPAVPSPDVEPPAASSPAISSPTTSSAATPTAREAWQEGARSPAPTAAAAPPAHDPAPALGTPQQSPAPGVPEELLRLRASIDNFDAALVHLLAERFKCTQRVGVLKAELNLPPSDPDREAQQIARLRALAAEAGLDPVFAEKFLAFIVAEVIRHHEEIAENRR